MPDARPQVAAEFAASRFWRLAPSGMRRRWWLFRALDILARAWPAAGPKRGLLVVRMDGIGDMVLFRRALDRYAAAFGVEKSDITVLGCLSWAAVAGTVFAGYRVIAIDEHRFARRPLYRFLTALRVRRLNAAVAVNDAYFRRALMADSLVWLSAAPRAVASRPYVSEKTRPEYAWYLGQASDVIDTGPYPTHEAVRHFRFLSAVAGREMAPESPAIPWREAPPPLPAGAPYVVLNTGSNEPGRRWPFARFAEVAERVLASGRRVVLVGAADQRPAAGALAALPAGPGVVDLTGRTPLPELLDVLANAACVVSNDTGPAHLAIGLGTPTVVIVGGGHFGCFVPYPESVRPAGARFVHQPMECYHCFWRCTRPHAEGAAFPCVSGVAVEAVWREIESLLQMRNDSAMTGGNGGA